MKTYEYKQNEMQNTKNAVIALGFFDGVHIGHRVLLRAAKEEAMKRGCAFSIFTFSAENGPVKKGALLYSTEDKLNIFEKLGADEVIVASFDSISHFSAEDFIDKILIGDLGCALAICGFDFRFGHGAKGNIKLLEERISSHGAGFMAINEQKADGEKISTSRIKDFLSAGYIEEANKLLGAPYFISGNVSRGLGIGHKMGIPTINFDIDSSRCPLKNGVYRTALKIEENLYHAVTNIGTCPTFGERKAHAETNIIDFEGSLYGEKIKVYFLGYLREEQAFSNEKDLISQINIDKIRAIKENGDDKTWQEIGQS